MSQVETNPLEALLRRCAAAAPEAWYPHEFARRSGVPLKQVNRCLEQLWLDGLLEKAPAHPEFGPGLRPSARGWQVLRDPALLRRLGANGFFGPDADGRGDRELDARRANAVLDALRTPRVAYVSRLLLGANVVVFLAGLWLAYRAGIALDYLGGPKTLTAAAVLFGVFAAFNVQAVARHLNATLRIVILIGLMFLAYKFNLFYFEAGGPAAEVRHACGLVTAADWMRGAWWRVLSACFVHLGLLHLLANMFMLSSAGWLLERMWGSGRFLAIYLLAGVTGSLVGLANSPGGIAGASGALCGLFAAEAVWVVFNGKYLPAKMQQGWWNNLTLNFMLIAGISFVPGVSFWGHAGGAAAGAAAAVCLHYQRYGPPVWRWAALLALVPIPFAGLLMIEHERRRPPSITAQQELREFLTRYDKRLGKPLSRERVEAFVDRVQPVLEEPPQRRDAGQVKAALAVLEGPREEFQKDLDRLNGLGPYRNAEVEAKRRGEVDHVKARLDVYVQAARCLDDGEERADENERARRDAIAKVKELRSPLEVREFNAKFTPAVQKRMAEGITLFRGEVEGYVKRPPEERVEATVKKLLSALARQEENLSALEQALDEARPYADEEVEGWRQIALNYTRARLQLFKLAERRLREGEPWTEDDMEQDNKVRDLAEKWQDLFKEKP